MADPLTAEAAPMLLDVRLARAPAWRMWLASNERLALGVSGFVTILVIWEMLIRLGIARSVFFSSPSAIFQAFRTSAATRAFWDDVGTSLLEFGLGYIVAIVVGIGVGFAAGWYRRVNYLVSPWLSAWYATPHIALIPLIVLWFGIGLGYKVFYVFLVAFFSVAINTMVGVQNAEQTYLEVARSFRASQLTLFRTVVLPGAVPYILTGIRLAAGRAWVGVVVAELVGSNHGIGFLITSAGQVLNTSKAMMGIVLLGIFGVLLGEILRRVEQRFDIWRPQQAGR